MNIYNFNITELENYFIENNDKKFRATQVFEWLYKKRIHSFDEMTNLKKEVIEHLKECFTIDTIKITEVEEDVDVKKFLF